MGAGDDRLLGGAGRDTMDGGTGNDRIIGGANSDQPSSGSGTDLFRYTQVAGSMAGNLIRDVIRDFTRAQGDKIDLSAIDGRTNVNVDQAFNFVGSDPLRKHAGEIRTIRSDGNTFREYG